MEIKLFRAPYVDDDGASRERVCAIVLGCDADDEALPDLVGDIAQALEQGKRVLAFDSEFTDAAWL